jgi:Tfp pilus assembly protein PilZ
MFPVAVLCGSAEIGHSVDEIKGKGASLVMTRDSKVEDVVYQINQELNRSKLDRAAPRVAVSLPAEISTASGSASSRVLNLSRSGAFIQTGEKHHANEELSLKITLPAPNAAVQATAAVRRIVVAGAGVSAGVGVEFTFMTDKARGALKAFLKDRETRVDLKGRFLQDTSG